MRRIATIVVLALVTACSSGNPDVNTEPASGDVIASAGDVDGDEGRKSTAATLGIPPGHLPPPGQCMTWIPGEPPGQQKKRYTSGNCSDIKRHVPPGGWLVYRPTEDKKEVQVSVYGTGRSEVTAVRIFDIATGALLREEPGS